MADDASFTLRYPKRLERRLFDVIAATENEATRTGLFIQAMENFLAQVEVCPSMVKIRPEEGQVSKTEQEAAPQEVGYTCWEAIKKAMEKQAARPLCERLQLFEKWYADPEGYKKEHSI